jgi:hypothetical protein
LVTNLDTRGGYLKGNTLVSWREITFIPETEQVEEKEELYQEEDDVYTKEDYQRYLREQEAKGNEEE